MKLNRIIVFFLIIIFLSLLAVNLPETGNIIKQEYELEETIVIKIIDGDTIETELGTIRMLGINTPEKNKYLYQEAKDFLLFLENQTIYVLRDIEDRDKYDRLLRYVFYENRLINLEIIEQGLGTAYMFEDISYKDKLLRAEQQARNQKLGLWEISDNKCSKCIELIQLNPQEEFFILKNNCNFDCNISSWYVKDAGRNIFDLENLEAGSELRINSKKSIWNNDHDSFFLRDSEEKLVIYYNY